MSALSDFSQQSLAEAALIFGTSTTTINGEDYEGIFDQFSAERELELGGYVGTYDATVVLQLADLAALAAPLERTLEGKSLTVEGRTFRIDQVGVDSAGVTLGLSNPHKRRQ